MAQNDDSYTPPFRTLTSYKIELDAGSLARGPFTFHIDVLSGGGTYDAKGKRYQGQGEGIGLGGPPTFTAVAETATALEVIDDVRLPFFAYDPSAVARWFKSEAACQAKD